MPYHLGLIHQGERIDAWIFALVELCQDFRMVSKIYRSASDTAPTASITDRATGNDGLPNMPFPAFPPGIKTRSEGD